MTDTPRHTMRSLTLLEAGDRVTPRSQDTGTPSQTKKTDEDKHTITEHQLHTLGFSEQETKQAQFQVDHKAHSHSRLV